MGGFQIFIQWQMAPRASKEIDGVEEESRNSLNIEMFMIFKKFIKYK